jgi:hypothetical protein
MFRAFVKPEPGRAQEPIRARSRRPGSRAALGPNWGGGPVPSPLGDRAHGEGLGVGRSPIPRALEPTISRPGEPHPRPLPVKNGEGRLQATASQHVADWSGERNFDILFLKNEKRANVLVRRSLTPARGTPGGCLDRSGERNVRDDKSGVRTRGVGAALGRSRASDRCRRFVQPSAPTGASESLGNGAATA